MDDVRTTDDAPVGCGALTIISIPSSDFLKVLSPFFFVFRIVLLDDIFLFADKGVSETVKGQQIEVSKRVLLLS